MFRKTKSAIASLIPRLYGKKEIWGVGHHTEEELGRVIDKIQESSPWRAGIEMTKKNFDGKYFKAVSRELQKKGVACYALDDSNLYEKHMRIIGAIRVMDENSYGRNQARLELTKENLASEHLSPEKAIELQLKKSRLEGMFEALELYPTRESLQEKHEMYTKERNDVMLQKTLKYKTDLVIIGDVHASAIAPMLKGYEYRSFMKD